MPRPLLLVLLALAAGRAPAAAIRPRPAPCPAQAQDLLEELRAGYEAASAEHRRALRLAREQGGPEPRHPIADYWPRFELAWRTGEGRALLWLALHAGELELPEEERVALARSLLGRLAADHAGAPWILELVERAERHERHVGAAAIDGFLEEVLERNPAPDVRAAAGLALGARLAERSPELAGELYSGLLARLPAAHPRAAEVRRRLELLVLQVGAPAPDFESVDAEGRPLRLADFRGQVVLLDFWGFWCAPCRREIPRLRALVERHAGRPFALVGVATDEDREQHLRLAREHGVTWRSAWQGSTSGPISAAYGVRTYPTMHVIDAAGRLRAVGVQGGRAEAVVDELLAELQGAGAGPASAGQASPAAEQPPPAAAAFLPPSLGVDELVERHDEALRRWSAAVGAAAPVLRARLLARPPALAFLADFEELAERGEGRALLWLVLNLGRLPEGPAAAAARRLELLEALVAEHADAAWIAGRADGGDGLDAAVAELWSSTAEHARLLATLHRFLHATRDETAARRVALELGLALATRPRDAADAEAGIELLEHVVRRWPADPLAERARAELERLREHGH